MAVPIPPFEVHLSSLHILGDLKYLHPLPGASFHLGGLCYPLWLGGTAVVRAEAATVPIWIVLSHY